MSPKFSMHASLQNFAGAALRQIYRPLVRYERRSWDVPVIYAANHTGFMDGPLLLAAISEPIHVLTKFEVFRGAAGAVLRAGGAVPIYWHGADKSALDHALAKLGSGESVALFPEGSRCAGRYDFIRDGIAYLVAKSHVPVVPVGVYGTRHTGQTKEMITRPWQQTAIVIGSPIQAREFLHDMKLPLTRQGLQEIGERIRQRLQHFTLESQDVVGIALPTDDVSKV